MFDLLTISGKNVLDIHPTALTIQCFANIWNRDKTNDKTQACKELGFIYWMYYWNSSYFKAFPNEKEREENVIQSLGFDKKWKPDKELLTAIAEYNKQQTNSFPALGDLAVARTTLDSLKAFLSELNPDERNNSGGLILKPAEIYTAVSKMADALLDIDGLEMRVKEQVELKADKIKGGGKQGSFEDSDDLDYLKG